MFYILAAVYFVMMFIGHLLLAKPADWHEPQTKAAGEGILATLKREPLTSYIGIWLMFYLNITCGLALISQEKMIVKCIGLASSVGIISTISAVFNAGGRLGFSAWADKMKDRNTIYKMIFILSIVFTAAVRASALYIFYNFFKASFVFIAKHLLSRNRQILCLCKLRKISLFQYVYDKFSEHIHICS